MVHQVITKFRSGAYHGHGASTAALKVVLAGHSR